MHGQRQVFVSKSNPAFECSLQLVEGRLNLLAVGALIIGIFDQYEGSAGGPANRGVFEGNLYAGGRYVNRDFGLAAKSLNVCGLWLCETALPEMLEDLIPDCLKRLIGIDPLIIDAQNGVVGIFGD